MLSAAPSTRPEGLRRLLGWRRLRAALVPSLLVGLLLSPGWRPSPAYAFLRACEIGILVLLAYGLLERWPRRLPPWTARWALQVVGTALAVPLSAAFLYWITTPAGAPPFWRDLDRLEGFGYFTGLGLLIAPWVAMVSLLRQVRDEAQDARRRLLQAQVEPHFLFNTLANVRELVDTGSPQASQVLANLIAYLRAALPRLQGPEPTLGEELALVRAYLEIMHMRMPDRLSFALEADPEADALFCPPLALLTLVENAVRHGIDPSEEGGRIEVRVRVSGGRCRAEVADTGVGLGAPSTAGTGLANLRERLELAFRGDAQLRLVDARPSGVRAELAFPAQRVPA